MRKFIRTCQECNHEQEAKDPAEYKNDSYRDLKCKRCKIDTLDYGSWREYDDNGKEVEVDWLE